MRVLYNRSSRSYPAVFFIYGQMRSVVVSLLTFLEYEECLVKIKEGSLL